MRLCLGVLLAALGSGQDIAFQLTRIPAPPVALQPPPKCSLTCFAQILTPHRLGSQLD